MLKHWQKISSVVRTRNPWWTYIVDEFVIPDTYRGEYHYVHTNGSSMVIPVLADQRLVLVNQYRYLHQKESLEFPCGSVKDGHDYQQTARLELAEETGLQAARLEYVGRFWPYNGVPDEICQVFIARELSGTRAEPDTTEEFELVVYSRQQLEDAINRNEIWDGMSLSAWTLARAQIISE